ncbi:hypothetical protein PAXRUDRAFT_107945, partial [Paxillus rubicundulus Ve08.2h10]
ITLLGLAQNLAHDASEIAPKSLVLRAQTRKIYRAILSQLILVVPTLPHLTTPQDSDRATPAQDGPETTPAISSLPTGLIIPTETPQHSNHSNKKPPHAG